MARWGASITCSPLRAGSRPRGRPARRPPSSTARASRAPKKGASIDRNGYGAGQKIKGRKRHLLVDTEGFLLCAIVHAAGIQDRDGGVLLMASLFGLFPFLRTLYADGGYQGPLFRGALARVPRHVEVEIVKRSDRAQGFELLPKRWIVERTIGWLHRCRCLACPKGMQSIKDWEKLNRRKALVFLRLASIRLMLRRLCNPS